MINAAEPVDMNAILQFYQDFMPYGLSRGVIIPTYGLAEHCVYVCSCELWHCNRSTASLEDESGIRYVRVNKSSLEMGNVELASDETVAEGAVQSFVSCGDPKFGSGVTLLIVDPVTLVSLEELKV